MKNLLYIIKSDRQAVISLLIVFIAVALIVLEFFSGSRTVDAGIPVADSCQQTSTDGQQYAVETKKVRLQSFDPNTADSTVLLGLGLQPWQVRSIYKYRAAGGVYTCPEDFARLYGLSVKKYRELLPYIRIAEDFRPASEIYKRNYGASGARNYETSGTRNYEGADSRNYGVSDSRNSVNPYPQKLKPGQTITLSTADTTTLQHVPGIGPYFARRIVKYREQLGGFVSKEQLLEIQDFPESALPFLELTTTEVRKININKASSEQLRSHPYITYMMAREILNYRRLRGTIIDINDFCLLPSFSKETIAKLRPYITY